MRPEGRPTKCTPGVRRAIAEAIKLGHSRTSAAALVGVSSAAVGRWMAAAEEPTGKVCYRKFRAAVLAAEAEALDRAHRAMHDLLGDDTPHATRFQAARFRLLTQGGLKEGQSVEVTGAGGGPVRVEVDPAEAIRSLAPLTPGAG